VVRGTLDPEYQRMEQRMVVAIARFPEIPSQREGEPLATKDEVVVDLAKPWSCCGGGGGQSGHDRSAGITTEPYVAGIKSSDAVYLLPPDALRKLVFG
jgi:hypothetical protein